MPAASVGATSEGLADNAAPSSSKSTPSAVAVAVAAVAVAAVDDGGPSVWPTKQHPGADVGGLDAGGAEARYLMVDRNMA